jgi:hypothetical protein
MLVGVNGIDNFSCYSTAVTECRSISLVSLAILIVDYNISVSSGYFFENAIRASVDGKTLNIEGSGVYSTTIIVNIYLNNNAQLDNATTFKSQTFLFFSSGWNSLSVKKMTILISDRNNNRNIFRHKSNRIISVEEINIKLLNLFIETRVFLI